MDATDDMRELHRKELIDDLQRTRDHITEALVTFVQLACQHEGDGWTNSDVVNSAEELANAVRMPEYAGEQLEREGER